MHVDPSSIGVGWTLCEEGTRLDPENIQELPKKEGVKLHVGAWVSCDAKAEKLELYYNEKDHVKQPKRPRKPIHREYESEEEFQGRIKEWEAALPYEVEVKVKGNAMTQVYYIDRLLPVYVEAVERMRQIDNKLGFYKKITIKAMATDVLTDKLNLLLKSTKKLMISTYLSTFHNPRI
jgi:hypothetical protein